MSWEPWLNGRRETEEREKYDPDDPALLVNILTKDMTEEDHERARQWVTDFIYAPPPPRE
jgi:hypothetical protein